MKPGYQDRLKKSDVGLKELACEVAYGGFVWVSLKANRSRCRNSSAMRSAS